MVMQAESEIEACMKAGDHEKNNTLMVASDSYPKKGYFDTHVDARFPDFGMRQKKERIHTTNPSNALNTFQTPIYRDAV